jgi:hypothetical protein
MFGVPFVKYTMYVRLSVRLPGKPVYMAQELFT